MLTSISSWMLPTCLCLTWFVVNAFSSESNVAGWSSNYGDTQADKEYTVAGEVSESYMTQLCGRTGTEIDAIEAHFNSGCEQRYGDEEGGSYVCLDPVSTGQCVTKVTLRLDKCWFCRKYRIYSLQYISSDGAVSANMGAEKGKQYTVSGAANRCLTKMQVRFEDVDAHCMFACHRYRLVGIRFHFSEMEWKTPEPVGPIIAPLIKLNPVFANDAFSSQQNVDGWSTRYGNTACQAGLSYTVAPADGTSFITKVCGRADDDEISAIEVHYSDGSASPLYGDTSGGEYTCWNVVASGQCITDVTVRLYQCSTCSKYRIQSMKFTASDGAVAPAILGFGSKEGTEYTVSGASNHCLTKMKVNFEDVGVLIVKGQYRLIGVQFSFDATSSIATSERSNPQTRNQALPISMGSSGNGNSNADHLDDNNDDVVDGRVSQDIHGEAKNTRRTGSAVEVLVVISLFLLAFIGLFAHGVRTRRTTKTQTGADQNRLLIEMEAYDLAGVEEAKGDNSSGVPYVIMDQN